ncbi:MAG: GLUG motif-containing protein [Candidatus Cloacimonas sp.]|nr:GLUG motif-containing protein [Candidatus Cloacimonas sp.]
MRTAILIFVLTCVCAWGMAQTATAPASGNGSSNYPYQIASLQNLYWIAASDDIVSTPSQQSRWSSYYIQITDIDATPTVTWFDGQGWSPIGRYIDEGDPDNLPFTGSYNGEGHVINGINIYLPSTLVVGFFGYIEGGMITNLGLINVEVRGGWDVGSLVGYQRYNSVVDNCHSSGNVNGHIWVGGLVGTQQYNSTISNSYSSGTVNVGGGYAGGLLAHQQVQCTVTNCSSTVTVSGGQANVGGLVGEQDGSFISNCFYSGNINGQSYVGGLVGNSIWSSIISSSYSMGTVRATSVVGGLVGSQQESFIYDCYSRANVYGGAFVGGLVATMADATITNSFCAGHVSGQSTVGGLVGSHLSSRAISSYWDIETTGQPTSVCGFGRMTEQMTYPHAANTYLNWNFTDVWTVDASSSTNSGYPYLSDVPVSAEDDVITALELPSLRNYPNPFNPETTICFNLPQNTEQMDLKIFNFRGQLVKTLIKSAPYPKGEASIVWNGKDDQGRNVTSGLYYYRLSTPFVTKTGKMTLMK